MTVEDIAFKMVPLAAAGVLFVVGTFVYRKRVYLLWSIIILLAFFTAAPMDPEARAGLADAGYSLFRRYIGGVVSTWDFIVLLTIIALSIQSSLLKGKEIRFNKVFVNRPVMAYFLLFVIAINVGLLATLFLQIDVFIVKDWFRAVAPIVYMFVLYILVVYLVRSEEDFMNTWRLLEIIAVAMAFYGFSRLYGILAGQIKTLAPGDLPIVLYSELLFFDLPILVYLTKIWSGQRLGFLRLLLLLIMVSFIAASTRRFNYVVLVIDVMLAFTISARAHIFTCVQGVLRSKYLVAAVLCFGGLVLIYSPDVIDNILFALRTINFWSGVGFEYTGAERIAQITNIISNLNEVPITWLSGYGIGTRWFVFEPLPTTTDIVGSYMGFDANVISGHSDWLPFFHVPYFSTLYRFGILGYCAIALIMYKIYRQYLTLISRTRGTIPNEKRRSILVALLSLALMGIPVNGDSTGPMGYLWAALYLGLIEGFRLSVSEGPQQKDIQHG